MVVNVEGQKYVVQWNYELDGEKVADYLRNVDRGRLVQFAKPYMFGAITFCRICVPGEDGKLQLLHTGFSPCRLSDMRLLPKAGYVLKDKKEGRKHSLMNALDETTFSRAQRAKFWSAYLAIWPPVGTEASHWEKAYVRKCMELEAFKHKVSEKLSVVEEMMARAGVSVPSE